jgi:hypothetical protein
MTQLPVGTGERPGRPERRTSPPRGQQHLGSRPGAGRAPAGWPPTPSSTSAWPSSCGSAGHHNASASLSTTVSSRRFSVGLTFVTWEHGGWRSSPNSPISGAPSRPPPANEPGSRSAASRLFRQGPAESGYRLRAKQLVTSPARLRSNRASVKPKDSWPPEGPAGCGRSPHLTARLLVLSHRPAPEISATQTLIRTGIEPAIAAG